MSQGCAELQEVGRTGGWSRKGFVSALRSPQGAQSGWRLAWAFLPLSPAFLSWGSQVGSSLCTPGHVPGPGKWCRPDPNGAEARTGPLGFCRTRRSPEQSLPSVSEEVGVKVGTEWVLGLGGTAQLCRGPGGDGRG